MFHLFFTIIIATPIKIEKGDRRPQKLAFTLYVTTDMIDCVPSTSTEKIELVEYATSTELMTEKPVVIVDVWVMVALPASVVERVVVSPSVIVVVTCPVDVESPVDMEVTVELYVDVAH